MHIDSNNVVNIKKGLKTVKLGFNLQKWNESKSKTWITIYGQTGAQTFQSMDDEKKMEMEYAELVNYTAKAIKYSALLLPKIVMFQT